MATEAEALSTLADRADEAARKGGSQLGKFLDDVEDLIRHVTPMEDSDISRARERVESSINSVRTTAGRGVHQAVESTKAAARATDGFVHNSPWTAIGIAAVFGMLLASVIRSK